MTTIPVPRSGMTAEDKRETATLALKGFLDSPNIDAWVRTRRHLHRFSLTNQILILLQAEARRIDGVQAAWRWKRAGYHPRKGASAIWIWTYRGRRRKGDNAWTCCGRKVTANACPTCNKPDHYFTPGPVFSPSDVVGFDDGQPPPLAPAPAPLTGNSHAHLWAPLHTWAIETPDVPVTAITLDDLRDGLHGYYSPDRHVIAVDSKLAPNHQVAVLVHELAHAHGGIDYQAYSRSHAELIAESAAYLACASLGLNTAEQSLAYIAGWGGRDGEPPADALHRHLATIDRLARALERAAQEEPA